MDMPRISAFQLIETSDQPMIYVRGTMDSGDLSEFINDGLTKMTELLLRSDVTASDVPFLSIEDDGEGPVAVLGLVLPRKVEGTEEVRSGTLRGGKKVTFYYQGSNEDMSRTYGELAGFLESNGLEPIGMYEFFVNGTEFGEDRLLTKIVVSLDR